MLQLFTMSKKSPPKFKDGVSYVSDFMVSFHILLKMHSYLVTEIVTEMVELSLLSKTVKLSSSYEMFCPHFQVSFEV